MAYHTDSIKQTNMYGNGSISSPDVRSFYCPPPSVASYHGAVMSVVMIRCRREEQWVVVVAEKYLINHARTTPRNGQPCRCRHCCASRMTVVDGQSSQRRHLSEYLNDACASRVLVSQLSLKYRGTQVSPLSVAPPLITPG